MQVTSGVARTIISRRTPRIFWATISRHHSGDESRTSSDSRWRSPAISPEVRAAVKITATVHRISVTTANGAEVEDRVPAPLISTIEQTNAVGNSRTRRTLTR